MATEKTTELNEPSARAKRARQIDRPRNTQQLRARVYDQSDLSSYSRRQRAMIYAADIFFYLLIGLICSTLRWEVEGGHHLESVYRNKRRAILTSWHSCIFGAVWFFRRRGVVVMSSRSFDAEYIGRFIKRYGYGTSRGSATRGGQRALAEMADCLSNDIDVGFTIDGPRGPAYIAKPGAITLARHTGQAVLPFHVASRRYLTLKTWDRLQIPLPFTRAVTIIGEPIYVDRDDGSGEAALKQAHLQATLDRLRLEGENYFN
ncbi:MAG TPA: lysophospholipid acyltransferase family protein [Blastocatellia bacterium]|nr:lysophospholipid acyltransferase family protein [Blastocatellia bacterium]